LRENPWGRSQKREKIVPRRNACQRQNNKKKVQGVGMKKRGENRSGHQRSHRKRSSNKIKNTWDKWGGEATLKARKAPGRKGETVIMLPPGRRLSQKRRGEKKKTGNQKEGPVN